MNDKPNTTSPAPPSIVLREGWAWRTFVRDGNVEYDCFALKGRAGVAFDANDRSVRVEEWVPADVVLAVIAANNPAALEPYLGRVAAERDALRRVGSAMADVLGEILGGQVVKDRHLEEGDEALIAWDDLARPATPPKPDTKEDQK